MVQNVATAFLQKWDWKQFIEHFFMIFRFDISISCPTFIEWSFHIHFAIQAARSLKRLRNVCVLVRMATSEMRWKGPWMGLHHVNFLKTLKTLTWCSPFPRLLSTRSTCTRMRRRKLWAAALKAVPGLDERTWRIWWFVSPFKNKSCLLLTVEFPSKLLIINAFIVELGQKINGDAMGCTHFAQDKHVHWCLQSKQ